MKVISKSTLITINDPEKFIDKVNKSIDEYQINGYEVEIQYGVAINTNFKPLHSAFIIAREQGV